MEERDVMQTFIGYHGTLSSACDNISKNGLDPAFVIKRTDHWLGQGVYFFDDIEIAKWWAECKKKNLQCLVVVYEAEIVAKKEKVLDLDDNSQVKLFCDRLLSDMSSLKKECSDRGLKLDSKTFRAVYFDYYKENYGISVIIRTFLKQNASYKGFYKNGEDLEMQKKMFTITGLGYFEKQICVSDKLCIQKNKIVFDESKEVV